jgi:hypothetical protein
MKGLIFVCVGVFTWAGILAASSPYQPPKPIKAPAPTASGCPAGYWEEISGGAPGPLGQGRRSFSVCVPIEADSSPL